MRNLQGSTEKAEFERFRALSVRMGVAGAYRSKAECDSVKSMWECQKRRQADCGKSNRVLYTKQLPEKTEVAFPGTTRKDRPVRTTGEEIGLTNVPPGAGAHAHFPVCGRVALTSWACPISIAFCGIE
jgi:hypothetical protein